MTFDWIIWVGYRPGVKDNPGDTAMEAIQDVLGISLGENEAVYTSRRYCIQCKGLGPKKADKIAVLEHGKIVGIGPHDQLLEICPLYKRLYEMQFQV